MSVSPLVRVSVIGGFAARRCCRFVRGLRCAVRPQALILRCWKAGYVAAPLVRWFPSWGSASQGRVVRGSLTLVFRGVSVIYLARAKSTGTSTLYVVAHCGWCSGFYAADQRILLDNRHPWG